MTGIRYLVRAAESALETGRSVRVLEILQGSARVSRLLASELQKEEVVQLPLSQEQAIFRAF
jgi:hypothetical protein